MIARAARRLAGAIAAGLAAVACAGCFAVPPPDDVPDQVKTDLEAALPHAVEAHASTGLDGFARYLAVGVEFESEGAINADALACALGTAAERVHGTSINAIRMSLYVTGDVTVDLEGYRREVNARLGEDALMGRTGKTGQVTNVSTSQVSALRQLADSPGCQRPR